ncbi:MAG: histidine kinase [Steroidobacteraceae bacterium]
MNASVLFSAGLPLIGRSISLKDRNYLWRLVLVVTIPYWIYMTLSRVIGFQLMTAGYPGIIIAPAQVRVLQHLLLLPLLLVFYRIALAIGWPGEARWLALTRHAAMALFFAVVARPLLLLLVALDRDDWSLLGNLFVTPWGSLLSLDIWLQTTSDFLMSYLLGLGVLLFVHNYRELKYQELNSARLQAENNQARLTALRMQLNPHFLFNTLNAAVAMIPASPQTAEQMLVRLGDLLRRSLRDGDMDLVPLSREIAFVCDYLEIQQLRFRDRLRYSIRVGEGLERAMVPSLILQPLAENAVMHGISAEDDTIQITVEARGRGRDLQLEVRNTHSGRDSHATGSSGIGLGNTRARLAALYGEHCSVELVRESEQVMSARIRIPLEVQYSALERKSA